MPPSPTLQSRPLRDIVYERLRDQIVDGTRSPRDRLKVNHLADEVGISPTPVREALLRLAKEGFLRADHNRGFRVADLDPVEIREIYPIVAGLESAALRQAGPPDPGQLDRLREINARLRKAASPKARLAIDTEWHRALIEPAGNERLGKELTLHKNVVRRYENRYMDDAGRVFGSVDEHDSVLDALDAGDLRLARRLLEDHWERGMEEVLAWVRS